MISEVRRCWLTGILSVLVLNEAHTLEWYDRVRGFVQPGRSNQMVDSGSVYAGTLRGVTSWSYGQQPRYMKGWSITLVTAFMARRDYNVPATNASHLHVKLSHVYQHA